MEQWRDIVGYEGLYQVSDRGRVKSLERRVNHSGGGTRVVQERILKPANFRGYLRVGLFKNSKGKTFEVHRLVATTFIPNPENKPEVNHLNGKQDNRVESLVWATKEENIDHAVRTGLMNNKGERNHSNKLTQKEVENIINTILNTSITYAEISIDYGVNPRTIQAINTGQNWDWLLPHLQRPLRPTRKYKKQGQ